MVPAALISLNHTNDRYSMSNQYQQLTNLQQTHIRYSLHCERWIAERKDCASALHSFKEITYRTNEWTKQLPRLKSWVISGDPEQWLKFRCLWWNVIVFKCRHLFYLFDFYCMVVQHLFFLKIYFFVPFLWWLWVRSTSSSTTSM